MSFLLFELTKTVFNFCLDLVNDNSTDIDFSILANLILLSAHIIVVLLYD